MKTKIIVIIYFTLTLNNLVAQSNILKDNSFTVTKLSSEKLQTFLKNKIEGSQFIMLGEQHGIKEVGEITNELYNIGLEYGYNTLCIETDPIAAKTIETIFSKSKNPKKALSELYQEYPYTIPFYNNRNDIKLFENIINHKGKIWGIDQVFMVEFRLIFDYLLKNTSNKQLKKAIEPLLIEAKNNYKTAVEEKNYMAPYIFKYSDELHKELLALCHTEEEKAILISLKATKEIYLHNFQKRYYLNNNERAKLMKNNFLNYYKEATLNKKTPKVLFKLGANHVKKGLNNTNVFDISNMISELAIINGKKSLHIYATGINGMKNMGNPFAPVSVVPFDNTKDLPKEVLENIEGLKEKYLIINTVPLRSITHKLSKEMETLVLKYDILIYIKDCEALEDLETD